MITWDDFDKIWASTSPLTPYSFSDPNYAQGWNFVGSTPPARQMWDSIQKQNDEKFKYLRDNFGTPNIVTQASQMTDTDKVYVYLGSEAGWNNGHWYYYDEGTSSWADGGVYNSVAFVTDTTLSIAGQPADAKATGDALALKSDLAGCTFTGNVSVNADFSVTGDATIGTDLSVAGDSTLTGNVSASGDVTVVGDVSSANMTTSADATIGGDLSVTGASTLAGNITTSGDISADNISATTNGTVGGNLSVTGTSTLTGNVNAGADITAVGDISADNLTTTTNATVGGSLSVAGTSTLTGNVTASGNINAVGDISSANLTTTNATIGGNATVTGDVSCANLTTSADATIGGDLTVTGDSTLADTTVNDLVVNNDLSVAGDSSLTNLSVSGTTALAGTSTAPTPSADDNSTKIATTEYVQTELKPIEVNADITDKRIGNIEKLLQGNLYDYQTDTDSKYIKTVPQGAMPYASLDSIGGKTIVMNQLVRSGASTSTENDVTFTNNGDGSWTINGTASADGSKRLDNRFISINSTHKYYLGGCPSGGSDSTFYLLVNGLKREYGDGRVDDSPSSTLYGSTTFVFKTGTSFSNLTIYPIVRDLTLMFGAGNEPSTVAEYKAIFPNDTDVTYSQGQLLSAGVTEVKSVGKNLWKMQMAGYGGNFYNIAVGSTLSFNGSSVPITDNGDGSFDFTCTGSWQGAFFLMPIDITKEHKLHCVVTGSAIRTSLYMIEKDYKVLYVVPSTSSTTTVDAVVGGAGTSHPTTKYICVTIGTNTANTTITVTQPMLEVSSTSSPYVPYVEHSYPIPAEIQALEGYGWSAGSVYNYIDYEAKKFIQNVGSRAYASGDESDSTVVTDMTTTYYPLNPAVETDISAYLTDDNLIEVEAGGTLTFPNSNGDDYRIDVPSQETYMVDLQSALGE